MRRVLRLSELFYRSRGLLIAPRTPQSQAVAATLGRLLNSATLPGPLDFEALLQPPQIGVAWVRQVAGARLWIYYKFDDAVLDVLDLGAVEPSIVD